MKNKKKLIITIISIILIVGIIFAYLYLKTDLFKTNKELFYKYLANAKILDSKLIENYIAIEDRKLKNNNSSTLTVNVSKMIENDETQVSDIQTFVTLKSNGLENRELNQSYRDFTILNNETQLARIKYIKDGNLYALTADNILNKYLAIENSNLKDLFKKIGFNDTNNIPDSIPDNYLELIQIDTNTLNEIIETYKMVIYNNISKDKYYKIKNNDNTEIIGLSLTEKEAGDILERLLETAKEDNTLLKLIEKKSQLLGYNNVTIQVVQERIQKSIDQLMEKQYSNEEKINISLVKKAKNIIQIKCEIAKINNQNSTEGEINNNKVINNIKLDFSKPNELQVLISENNLDIMNFNLLYSYDENNINTNIELNDKKENTITKIQNQINNFQTDSITENNVINIETNNSGKYQINILNNTNIKQDIQIEKLTTSNSVKLNNQTAEDLSSLFVAIRNRAINVYAPFINIFLNNGMSQQ